MEPSESFKADSGRVPQMYKQHKHCVLKIHRLHLTVLFVIFNLNGKTYFGDPRQNDGVTSPSKGQLSKIILVGSICHSAPLCLLPFVFHQGVQNWDFHDP
jgi:hypothetical protein